MTAALPFKPDHYFLIALAAKVAPKSYDCTLVEHLCRCKPTMSCCKSCTLIFLPWSLLPSKPWRVTCCLCKMLSTLLRQTKSSTFRDSRCACSFAVPVIEGPPTQSRPTPSSDQPKTSSTSKKRKPATSASADSDKSASAGRASATDSASDTAAAEPSKPVYSALQTIHWLEYQYERQQESRREHRSHHWHWHAHSSHISMSSSSRIRSLLTQASV